ncbi:MAG: phosphatidylglycerol lysyltransferase domain-containing protein [Clostridiales bacterium]|nr:phosphatidylglycerol lysyltransferase domain-containing protein [Clostridiales bacterium]
MRRVQSGGLHHHDQEKRMNMPSFPEFKLVGLEDRETVQHFIRRFPSAACEINFANIFIWRNFEHPKLTTINGNLCIQCEPPSEPAYFLQPLGDTDIRRTVETCLTFSPRLSRVPEDFVEQHCSEFRRELDANNFDYVYLTSDLISLKGKKYDGKRNRIRKFERNTRYRYLTLSPEHLEGCRRLFEQWVEAKAEHRQPVGEEQKTAILEAIAHFQELELVGGAIEVEGRVEAFSIGGRLNADTAVIHIEIANPDYDGLSQLINREFVRHEWAAFRFINREQDLGVAGLRRAKMSYHPHHLVKKYNVWNGSAQRQTSSSAG